MASEVEGVSVPIRADDKEFVRAMARFDQEIRRAEKRGEDSARKIEKSSGKMMGGFGVGKIAGFLGVGAALGQSQIISAGFGLLGDLVGAYLDQKLAPVAEKLAGATTPEEFGKVLGEGIPNIFAEIIRDGIVLAIPAILQAFGGLLDPGGTTTDVREAFDASRSTRGGVRGDLERANQGQGEPIIIGFNRLLSHIFDTPGMVPGGGLGRFP